MSHGVIPTGMFTWGNPMEGSKTATSLVPRFVTHPYSGGAQSGVAANSRTASANANLFIYGTPGGGGGSGRPAGCVKTALIGLNVVPCSKSGTNPGLGSPPFTLNGSW